MKKRLRKKQHIGEFKQLGFSIECRLRPAMSAGDSDKFISDFINQTIEPHSLVFSGGGCADRGWAGVVCRDHPYNSITESDRSVVTSWLEKQPEIETFRVSKDWDVWHGLNPFDQKISEPID